MVWAAWRKGDKTMVVLGVDAHKRTPTVVAVDQLGRRLGERTTGTTSQDHLGLLGWAEKFGQQRLWAGERIARVPTKLMAHARDAARSYGKSDPIDALAVAGAALREPQLPAAQLEGPARQVRLLVDHREQPGRRTHPRHQPAALAPAGARPVLAATGQDVVATQAPAGDW
jgi:hypothetical protein